MLSGSRTGKKHWFCASMVIVIVTLLTLSWLTVRPDSPVNRANYNRIQVGMTSHNVDSLLGLPMEDLPPLSYEDIRADEDVAMLVTTWPHSIRHWKTDTHMITVIFDAEGKVVGKSYSRDPEVGLFRRVIDWLGL